MVKKITKKGKLTNRPPSTALKKGEGDYLPEESLNLNPKELQFCSNYTALGENSFGRKELSAELAGYPTPRNAAYRLLQRPDIQQQIALLTAKHLERHRITVDGVLADIIHDRTLARQRGDISTALRADEILARYLKMFSDLRIDFCVTDERISDEKRQEAIALAEQRLLGTSTGLLPEPVTVRGENGKIILVNPAEQDGPDAGIEADLTDSCQAFDENSVFEQINGNAN